MRCFLNDKTAAALMSQHAHVILLSIAVLVVANVLGKKIFNIFV